MNIGYYKRVGNLKRDSVTTIDSFLQDVKQGKWQDLIFKVRAVKDKKQRNLLKEDILPCFTLSGLFTSRYDNAIEKHSGYIGMDIDNLTDAEEVKDRLIKTDPYIYAIFVTASGNGLCCIFKVNPNPKKHREQFYSISKYFLDKYDIVVDATGINESRIRYVSYDPNLYIRMDFIKEFDVKYEFPKKEKITDVVFSQEDFQSLMHQIIEQQIDLTEDYGNWYRIGFAFAHQFGEEGRQYFHDISRISHKYSTDTCNKQYDACLKAKGIHTTTISTFYYFCKNAGLKIYSNKTTLITRAVKQGGKAGLDIPTIQENLKKFENIEVSQEQLTSISRSKATINEDDIISETEFFIKQNYDLRKNEISRYIENNGKAMNQEDYNTIFLKCKKVIDKVTYDLVDRMICSNFIPSYNPLTSFIEDNRHINSTGNIERLFSSIRTDKPEIALKFGTKWLVSMIASIYGYHSPLMLVLSGAKQNTGKTEFFRRLLPDQLKKYYAESKLDEGKDAYILMTQKLLIIDDEMGGKNKKESKHIKEMLSKQTFSLREPYGRRNVELRRLAVLAGTTNESEILNDTTGNRRILPINVLGIDHNIYNSVDKTHLFMECVNLFESGYDWQMKFNDIEELANNTEMFEATSLEGELISKYFTFGTQAMTATDIKIIIEGRSGQRVSLERICKELKYKGFTQKRKVIQGQNCRVYEVKDLQILEKPEGVKDSENLF